MLRYMLYNLYYIFKAKNTFLIGRGIIIIVLYSLSMTYMSYAAGAVKNQQAQKARAQQQKQAAVQAAQAQHRSAPRASGTGQPQLQVRVHGTATGRKQKMQHMDISKIIPIDDAEPQDTKPVDISSLIDSLYTSGKAWPTISNQQAKTAIVAHFINEYKKRGITISKPPEYYVSVIDNITSRNARLLSGPFNNVLEVVTIIEYDFDNGQDKDLMVKKVLGEEGYIRNKKRLGRE